jgi:hypothetical protein
VSFLPVMAGVIGGSLYFSEGEKGIPTDSNCSYLAPVSTDVAALVAGLYLASRGTTAGEPWVAFIGAAVAAIHVRQFIDHKSRTLI